MPDDLLLLPVVITVVFLVLAGFIVGFTLLFQRRQVENLQEKQTLQAQYDQAALQAQIEIQNQTLQTVGQELHDNIGQILTVVRLHLNTLEEENQQAAIQQRIEQSNTLVEQAIQSLRGLSKSLDGFVVDEFGLAESIRHELQRLEQTKKFATDLSVQGEPYALGHNADIILFRIVQETLNNAIKHAHATHMSVRIHYVPDRFALTVSDNGIGFNYTDVAGNSLEHTGSGLRNMQRRATLIGCVCTFDSSPGYGTTVRIEKVIDNLTH
jgi:two-component system, NarL family, sensor kinase